MPTVEESACLSADDKAKFDICFYDENGSTKQFYTDMCDCVSSEVGECNPDSISHLIDCSISKSSNITIPPESVKCLQDNLSPKATECVKIEFPTLGKLDGESGTVPPPKAAPKAAPKAPRVPVKKVAPGKQKQQPKKQG